MEKRCWQGSGNRGNNIPQGSHRWVQLCWSSDIAVCSSGILEVPELLCIAVQEGPAAIVCTGQWSPTGIRRHHGHHRLARGEILSNCRQVHDRDGVESVVAPSDTHKPPNHQVREQCVHTLTHKHRDRHTRINMHTHTDTTTTYTHTFMHTYHHNTYTHVYTYISSQHTSIHLRTKVHLCQTMDFKQHQGQPRTRQTKECFTCG